MSDIATLSYVVNATDSASAVFARIAGSADELHHKLDEIGKANEVARVALAGDKEATLALDKLDFKMARFAKQVAEGKVGVEGQARALLDIERVSLALDKLGRKEVTATVKVEVDRSWLSRLRGMLPGGDAGGGLFGGAGAAAGGAASGAGGLFGGGGDITMLIKAAALGAGGVGIASLLPALLPTLLGGGVALGGTGLGYALGAKANKQLQSLAKSLSSGTTAADKAKNLAIQKQMTQIRQRNAGPLGVYGAATDLGQSALGTLSGALTSRPFLGATGTGGGAFGQSFLQGLIPILKQIGGFIKSIGPGLGDLFRASLPFLKMFVDFLEKAGKTLLPVFTSMLKQMTPYLPLITQGLMAILQGLVGMLKAIGPQGMQDSAKIFVGLCKVMGFALTVLGKVINFIAVATYDTAHKIHQYWDDARHWTAVTFDQIRHDIFTWASDVVTIFKIWGLKIKMEFLDVAIAALKTVDTIVSGFAKLPGPLGKPFKTAKAAIDKELHGMEVSAAQTTARIQGSFDKLHNKHVTLDLFGSGKWAAHTRTEMGAGGLPLAASGMFVSAGSAPTADDVLIRASRGELVVPARMVSAGMVDHLRGAIPGFAGGGIIPTYGPARNAAGEPPWVAHNAAVTEGQIVSGEGNAFAAAWKKFMDGSGAAIARYAMRFIGRIPYVWGGTAVPGGADCSGFTEAVYSRYGINAPRTSEAQGAWVRRGPPVPGGLAFYHSPPGGPDPGHVAIVGFGGQVISQGGGMGPQLMGLHSMPLLWTGTPPGGFGRLGGGAFGGSTPGAMSGAAIARLWTSLGGPGWAAANMARIAFSESGDRPGERQTGMPPGQTGWGLYQITPTSGITQNGRFGNLLNASNNTRAAIALFSSGGYTPWASDPVGRSLLARSRGFDSGGWLPPGVSVAVNRTGRHERVLGPGEGGTVININVTASPGTNRRALAQELGDLILYHTKSGGRLYPQGVQPR